MKLRYSALAVAVACCAMSSQGWADEAAAKKWIDSEFQPSIDVLAFISGKLLYLVTDL